MAETESQNLSPENVGSNNEIVPDEKIEELKTNAERNAEDLKLSKRYGHYQKQLTDIAHGKAKKENTEREQERNQPGLDIS